MAERLSMAEIVRYFEDYEIDHLGWFALAGAGMVDSLKSFDVASAQTTGKAIAGNDVLYEDEEWLLEAVDRDLVTAQIFNAGRPARALL